MGYDEALEIIIDALGGLPSFGKKKDDEENACKDIDCVDCHGKGVCGKEKNGK